ncbi:hypothetical protein [Tuanshanicoccus lijuaniae]|uniref:hypothetical protein n=1 Tax=Aerococcaceae bacterium zg-1292 TaxID=2774330 RepID=UPI001BD87EC4|nr:hypothetical protein [Aerococcaceae bacterium zg-A91]MBS4458091.1 hypothetical protein [Aerococcaceae bacterium zg-BR33]MBS4458745.1 hypothetical protein [Aerococcaceae bacterium zg-BR33]
MKKRNVLLKTAVVHTSPFNLEGRINSQMEKIYDEEGFLNIKGVKCESLKNEIVVIIFYEVLNYEED